MKALTLWAGMIWAAVFGVLLAGLQGCVVAPRPVSVQRNPVTCAVTAQATICTQSWVMPNRSGQIVQPVMMGEP